VVKQIKKFTIDLTLKQMREVLKVILSNEKVVHNKIVMNVVRKIQRVLEKETGNWWV